MTDSFSGHQAARVAAALVVLLAVGSPPQGRGAELLMLVLVLAGVAVFTHMASHGNGTLDTRPSCSCGAT